VIWPIRFSYLESVLISGNPWPFELTNFVTLARVIKTQGRHGEVAAEIHTDIPGRLHAGMKIQALAEHGSRRELQIDNVWPHKNWQVLKFAGVDSISDAEVLVGSELQVPASERAQLEPGTTYVSDLVGCMLLNVIARLGL